MYLLSVGYAYSSECVIEYIYPPAALFIQRYCVEFQHSVRFELYVFALENICW